MIKIVIVDVKLWWWKISGVFQNKQTTRSGLWIDKQTSRVFSIFAVQRIDDYYWSTERILSLSPVKGISPICSRLIQVVLYKTLQEVISS